MTIFEERCISLMKSKYVLLDFDEFPIFNRIKLQKYGTKITQFNFIEITLTFQDGKSKNNYFIQGINDFIPINYPENKFCFVLIEKSIENKKTNYLSNFYFLQNKCILTKISTWQHCFKA